MTERRSGHGSNAIAKLIMIPNALPFDADSTSVLVAADFAGTQQLYRLHHRPGLAKQLTSEAEPIGAGLLLPEGQVVLSRDTRGDENSQLYLLRGAQLEPLVVHPGSLNWAIQVTNDGSLLAYSSNRRNGRDFDVYLRHLANGHEWCAFDGGGIARATGFSPHGGSLAVVRETNRPHDRELWIIDTRSGAAAEVFAHDEPAWLGAPAWLDEARFIVPSTVEREVAALVREDGAVVLESHWNLQCWADRAGRLLLVEENADGYSRLELRDAESLDLRHVVQLPGRGVVEQALFTPDSSSIVFGFSSPVEPPNVWISPVGGSDAVRLTSIDPPRGLQEPTLHRFESFDALPIPVFVWTPRGTGPAPVVVMVHGGPESQFRPEWLPSFTPFIQYLLTRGIAVAAPNVRGSTGYGRHFQHLDDGRLRLNSVQDLAALHSWIGAHPSLDASRTAIYGRSYGGYMTLAALAFQPTLWAAGVESVGISNLVSFLENTSEYRREAREREYGRLAFDRDFLIEASPLTHAHQIRAPLFIQHGLNDPRVPLAEAEQIHRVLTANRVRCELLVYPDEGHRISRRENRIDFFARAAAFLEDVLLQHAKH